MRSRFYRTEAIVIKKKDIGETDQLVTFFTRQYGKLTARARGVRRLTSKRAASLDLFNHVMVYFYRREEWYTLTEVKLLDSFAHLKTSLAKIALSFRTAELLDRLLAAEQAHAAIFLKTLGFLGTLEDQAVPEEDPLTVFKRELLTEIGFGVPADVTDLTLDQYLESITDRRPAADGFLTP